MPTRGLYVGYLIPCSRMRRQKVWAILRIPHEIAETGLFPILVYFNFKQHQLSPAYYLPDRLIPSFLDHLPDINTCAHVWDVLLLEEVAFLFRVTLALPAGLERGCSSRNGRDHGSSYGKFCTTLIILSSSTEFHSILV